MTTEQFPVNPKGLLAFLETQSPSTNEYFHRMLKTPSACDFLRNNFFIQVEKEFMSKCLEDYTSVADLYQEVEAKSKEKEAKQGWFKRNIVVPLLTPALGKLIGIDMRGMRKKQRGELGDAMFLLSLYLHL